MQFFRICCWTEHGQRALSCQSATPSSAVIQRGRSAPPQSAISYLVCGCIAPLYISVLVRWLFLILYQQFRCGKEKIEARGSREAAREGERLSTKRANVFCIIFLSYFLVLLSTSYTILVCNQRLLNFLHSFGIQLTHAY